MFSDRVITKGFDRRICTVGYTRLQSEVAQRVLDAYHSACIYTEEPDIPQGRRKPFIVVEGNHRPSKLDSNGLYNSASGEM